MPRARLAKSLSTLASGGSGCEILVSTVTFCTKEKNYMGRFPPIDHGFHYWGGHLSARSIYPFQHFRGHAPPKSRWGQSGNGKNGVCLCMWEVGFEIMVTCSLASLFSFLFLFPPQLLVCMCLGA